MTNMTNQHIKFRFDFEASPVEALAIAEAIEQKAIALNMIGTRISESSRVIGQEVLDQSSALETIAMVLRSEAETFL